MLERLHCKHRSKIKYIKYVSWKPWS